MNINDIKAAEEAQTCETVWVKTVEDTFGGFEVYLLPAPSCKKENDHESAKEEK